MTAQASRRQQLNSNKVNTPESFCNKAFWGVFLALCQELG